jgi:hypothetical protein
VVGWVGGWVVGWGEIEIKAKLSPAKAGAWAELGNNESFTLFSYLPGSIICPSIQFQFHIFLTNAHGQIRKF